MHTAVGAPSPTIHGGLVRLVRSGSVKLVSHQDGFESLSLHSALMVELEDTLVLETSARKGVEVRLLLGAQVSCIGSLTLDKTPLLA